MAHARGLWQLQLPPACSSARARNASNGRTFTGKRFGPAIDQAAGYEGQTKCDPHAKPGLISFRRLVMKAFPGTGEGYFIRACTIGGQSEHKDGRAWDWMVNYYKTKDRKKVNALLDWLFAKDARGRKYARARRLGIMYLIWNDRIWFPWEGWREYTGHRLTATTCTSASAGPAPRRRRVSGTRSRPFVMGASSNGSTPGFWSTTGNGIVMTAGAADHAGDLGRGFTAGNVAGIASTPSGNGYWLAKRGGKVIPFGDAQRRGSFKGQGFVTDIVATPRGTGYWVVAKSGRVAAFGNADHFGNDPSNADITGIAPTPTGNGYWLLSRQGKMFPLRRRRATRRAEDRLAERRRYRGDLNPPGVLDRHSRGEGSPHTAPPISTATSARETSTARSSRSSTTLEQRATGPSMPTAGPWHSEQPPTSSRTRSISRARTRPTKFHWTRPPRRPSSSSASSWVES